MEVNELTPIQKRVYYIIKDFIEQKGYSPSYREVARLNGNNSVATIKYHLDNLKEKGFITYEKGLNRTLKIIK